MKASADREQADLGDYDPIRQNEISEHADCVLEDGVWWFDHGMQCQHTVLHHQLQSPDEAVIAFLNSYYAYDPAVTDINYWGEAHAAKVRVALRAAGERS